MTSSRRRKWYRTVGLLAGILGACREVTVLLTPALASEGMGAAVGYALLTRGAGRTGLVYLQLSDSLAVQVDSAALRTSLEPWTLEFYESVEHWSINGASDCACSGVVYLGAVPALEGRFLTQDVAVTVPVGRAALYRVTVKWVGHRWEFSELRVLTTT